MSDSNSWVGSADRNRIRGLMARSVHVIATAREGLDKSSNDLDHLSDTSEPGASKRRPGRPKMTGVKLPGSPTPRPKTPLSNTPGPKLPAQPAKSKLPSPKLPNAKRPAPKRPEAELSLEPLPPLEPLRPLRTKPTGETTPALKAQSSLASYASLEPVEKEQNTSGRRRALFRRFLRTRNLEDVRPLERFQRSDAEDVEAEDVHAEDADTDDPTTGTDGWLSKFRKRRAERRMARPAENHSAGLDTKTLDALILEDDTDRGDLRQRNHTQGDHIQGDHTQDDLNRDNFLRDDLARHDVDQSDLDRNDLDRNDLDWTGAEQNSLDQAPPWKDARFTGEPWEWRGAEPEPERRSRLSIFVSWAQRLDSLTNTVAGVLILTLLGFWTVEKSPPAADEMASRTEAETTRAPDPAPAVERAEADVTGIPIPGEDPMAALIARTGLPGATPEQVQTIPTAQGLRVLPTAFPKPLPTKPRDISTMHSWARASLLAAPGLALLPYTSLPQVLPSVPPDIAGHILITTPQ